MVTNPIEKPLVCSGSRLPDIDQLEITIVKYVNSLLITKINRFVGHVRCKNSFQMTRNATTPPKNVFAFLKQAVIFD